MTVVKMAVGEMTFSHERIILPLLITREARQKASFLFMVNKAGIGSFAQCQLVQSELICPFGPTCIGRTGIGRKIAASNKATVKVD